MSTGLYSGVSGLALGTGLYKGTQGLWGGASGLINEFGATLNLDFLAGAPLDSRITFSRTTNATLVDATGRVTYAPNNLVTYSEQFGNAYWVKANATVTANATTAPDGTTTADAIIENTATGTHGVNGSVSVTTGVSYALSVYAKQNGRSLLRIGSASTSKYAVFDLIAGVVQYVDAGVSASITSVGDGWYRCAATQPETATGSTNFLFRTQSTTSEWPGTGQYTGNGVSGVFLWGAQLEAVTYQTPPSTYVQTVASAYYGPRFDYNPATLAPLGLLIEEQRVNLALQSNGFGTTPWSTGASFTTTANQIISPDGTNNGWKFELTTGAAANLFQTITATSTSCAYSLYVKQGTGPTTANVFGIRNSTTATNLVFIQLNYSTGAFVYTAGSTGATVTNAGNGWWRVQMVVTSGITVGNSLFVYAMSTSGAAGDFAYLYGAQFEAGAFATSFIPTAASTVTRAADIASMTDTNFSSWYNQSEGTVVVDCNQVVGATNTGLVYAISDNTFNNSQYGNYQSGSSFRGANYIVGGVGQTGDIASFTIANVAVPLKDAFTYAVNNFGESLNGQTTRTDSVGVVNTASNRMYIGSNWGGGGNFLNGYIRSITYYPQRLANAQLQALTA